MIIDEERIVWHYRSMPLGFPIDRTDEDFAGARTGPYNAIGIEYHDADSGILFRNGYLIHDLYSDIEGVARSKAKAKILLREWLESQAVRISESTSEFLQ